MKNLIVGYPFHFVPLLVFYYAVSPVLVRLSKRFGWLIIAAIAVYQLVLINLQFPGALGFQFPAWMKYLAPPVLSSTLADWGIFFPLGIIYSLKARQVNPALARLKWGFAILTVLFFVVSVLDAAKVVRFPLAGFLAASMLMFFLPSIRRDTIPFVRQFEKVGKKSYGLYLTNLIVLFLLLAVVKAVIPGVLHIPIALLPFLFATALAIPLAVMSFLERGVSVRRAYPYVFG
jgi:peptidoglycan/LPS O-acetylase OafA/YrhL